MIEKIKPRYVKSEFVIDHLSSKYPEDILHGYFWVWFIITVVDYPPWITLCRFFVCLKFVKYDGVWSLTRLNFTKISIKIEKYDKVWGDKVLSDTVWKLIFSRNPPYLWLNNKTDHIWAVSRSVGWNDAIIKLGDHTSAKYLNNIRYCSHYFNGFTIMKPLLGTNHTVFHNKIKKKPEKKDAHKDSPETIDLNLMCA